MKAGEEKRGGQMQSETDVNRQAERQHGKLEREVGFILRQVSAKGERVQM